MPSVPPSANGSSVFYLNEMSRIFFILSLCIKAILKVCSLGKSSGIIRNHARHVNSLLTSRGSKWAGLEWSLDIWWILNKQRNVWWSIVHLSKLWATIENTRSSSFFCFFFNYLLHVGNIFLSQSNVPLLFQSLLNDSFSLCLYFFLSCLLLFYHILWSTEF